jgi:hypothetical protein
LRPRPSMPARRVISARCAALAVINTTRDDHVTHPASLRYFHRQPLARCLDTLQFAGYNLFALIENDFQLEKTI